VIGRRERHRACVGRKPLGMSTGPTLGQLVGDSRDVERSQDEEQFRHRVETFDSVSKKDFFIVVAQVVLSHRTLARLASDVGTVATNVLDSMCLAAAAVLSGGRYRQSSRAVCSAHRPPCDGNDVAAMDAQTVSDWLSQKMRATPRAGSTTPGPRPSC